MSFNLDLEEEEYILECQKCKEYMKKIGGKWISSSFENLKVGDVIYVDYITSSQKYMYTHIPECGIVKEIIKCNHSNSDFSYNGFIAVNILNHNNHDVNIIKDKLGYYSHSYTMIIKKNI